MHRGTEENVKNSGLSYRQINISEDKQNLSL
jgi:hypothetical protein